MWNQHQLKKTLSYSKSQLNCCELQTVLGSLGFFFLNRSLHVDSSHVLLRRNMWVRCGLGVRLGTEIGTAQPSYGIVVFSSVKASQYANHPNHPSPFVSPRYAAFVSDRNGELRAPLSRVPVVCSHWARKMG